MDEGYNIAVVGATGAVGGEMIALLEERKFPVKNLIPLASENSIGKDVEYLGEDIPTEVLNEKSFYDVDIALFSAGGDISKKYAPIAVDAGAVVIDNTSAFRMEEDIPLVVPEVNAAAISDFKTRRIIANPNCSTIQLVVVLDPLHRYAGIRRAVVSTYQSVSGAGLKAIEELSKQSVDLFSEGECKVENFPHRIAFNCIPHIGTFNDDASTDEEMKLIRETKKILGDDNVKVAATAVRVPVFCGHSESVNLEFEDPIDPDRAREILMESNGIVVMDETNLCRYPMPIEAVGKDEVYVGRIRKDDTVENGLAMWIVADNLRKGAALNAVQIAEILVKEYL